MFLSHFLSVWSIKSLNTVLLRRSRQTRCSNRYAALVSTSIIPKQCAGNISRCSLCTSFPWIVDRWWKTSFISTTQCNYRLTIVKAHSSPLFYICLGDWNSIRTNQYSKRIARVHLRMGLCWLSAIRTISTVCTEGLRSYGWMWLEHTEFDYIDGVVLLFVFFPSVFVRPSSVPNIPSNDFSQLPSYFPVHGGQIPLKIFTPQMYGSLSF